MPVGFGRKSIISNGRPLAEMVHLKRSIIEVKAKSDCLAHALIIAIVRITKDPNFIAYRRGYKILQKVQHLLQTTGISLQHGGGIQELQKFQDHFSEYRIVVYGGLDCRDIIFEGKVHPKRESTCFIMTKSSLSRDRKFNRSHG